MEFKRYNLLYIEKVGDLISPLSHICELKV